MHLTTTVVRRLLPVVYGISKAGVRVSTPCFPWTICTVGDDAYFATQSVNKDVQVCGIADGVGGWRSHGVDPSVYAKDLMASCGKVASHGGTPAEILRKGYEEVLQVHSESYGGSTACILSLDSTRGILHSANLGDSGFMVVRGGSVVQRSQELVHYFNCPFQLSNHPPWLATTAFISDRPTAAAVSSLRVKEGDLVVLATDGLFDNVFDTEVLEMLKAIKDTANEAEVKKGCIELVEKAYQYSQDVFYRSPFEERSEALYFGGKPDDITVIVAAVINETVDNS